MAANLPILVKTEENPEGWTYPSIDNYYQHIGKNILKAGINWRVVESECSIIRGDSILAKYEFYLYDDKEDKHWSSLSVIHPYEGATTSGKMLSYAEKMFMRQLVKAVTGEPDADATASKKTPKKNVVVELVKPENSPIADKISKGIGEARNEKELEDLWNISLGDLDTLKKIDKNLFDRIRHEFIERKEELNV